MIKRVEEIIYNFLLGFWTPFSFLLAIAFIVDDNDGIGIFFTILTVIAYLFLLVPTNMNFFEQTQNKKEKIILIISYIIGIFISIFLYKGNESINVTLMGILILGNICFLILNKKSNIIYNVLLFILNLILIFLNINCFNIF